MRAEKEDVELLYFDPRELRTKEFNDFIDHFLETGNADEVVFSRLTVMQRHMYSVLNRAFARLERRREFISEITTEDYDETG